jgi:hypothetical protein
VSSRQHAGPRPSGPEVPEPSLAERARTLAAVGRIGSRSTHSRKFPGFPFGSVMPYAVDQQGRPVMFISSMAMHTQNLVQNAAAAVVEIPGQHSGPIRSSRKLK